MRDRRSVLPRLRAESRSYRDVTGGSVATYEGVILGSETDQQHFVAFDLSTVKGGNLLPLELAISAYEATPDVVVLRDTSGRSPRGQAQLAQVVAEIGRLGLPLVLQTSARLSDRYLTRLYQEPPPSQRILNTLTGNLAWNIGAGLHIGDLGLDLPLEDPGARQVRQVNTLVVPAGTDDPVPDRPLDLASDYEILLNIGPAVAGSLLNDLDGRWPEDKLPAGALELHAVLHLDGMTAPLAVPFNLPEDGQSDWVRLPVRTPEGPAALRGQLVVYYEVVAVHVQELELPVGTGAHGPRATLVYRLTGTFADMLYLKDRTASITAPPSPSRVLVNGISFADSPFSVTTNEADRLALAARVSLYESNFDVINNVEVTRYQEGGGCKTKNQYHDDLVRLAKVGIRLFNAVFEEGTTQTVKLALRELIRHEAERDRVAVLSVAQTGPISPAAELVPWASIYDLPIDPEAEKFDLCPSVDEYGPAQHRTPIPPHCPHNDIPGHLGMICPFGFWGLSCVIELPPRSERDIRDFVLKQGRPITVLGAADTGLDQKLRNAHGKNLSKLATANSAQVDMLDVEVGTRLRELLAGETMDIAYLYSHGIPDNATIGVRAGTKLTFGPASVSADTIISWSDNGVVWPPPHWEQRRPLVMLNGCHTTEKTSGMLAGFVPAFVRSGASGVVGTETAIDQDVANVVGELLIGQLLAGATVGAAIRAMRWQLLAKGNVMGLTYTPHCLAGLRMRAQVTGRS